MYFKPCLKKVKKKFDFFIDVQKKGVYNKNRLVEIPQEARFGAEWQSGYAEDCKSLYIGSIPVSASKILFRDSSAVEQSAVNRLVVGSNPTRGANMKTRLKRRVFF